jgi:hypothetical protein
MAVFTLTPLSSLSGSIAEGGSIEFTIIEGGFTGVGGAAIASELDIVPLIPGLDASNVQDGLSELVAGQGIKIAFSFGDASPTTILTAQAGQRIKTVAIALGIAFNGTAPQLSIGDAASPGRLFPSAAIDPKDAAEWEYNPNHLFTVATPILLTITPDGSTQGSGFIYIQRS